MRKVRPRGTAKSSTRYSMKCGKAAVFPKNDPGTRKQVQRVPPGMVWCLVGYRDSCRTHPVCTLHMIGTACVLALGCIFQSVSAFNNPTCTVYTYIISDKNVPRRFVAKCLYTCSPAPPSVNGETENRYVVFEGGTSIRLVELTCAIQLGALMDRDRYRVQWIASNTPAVITMDTFNLTRDISAQSSVTYHCNVRIQHSNDEQDSSSYDGPEITIHKNGEFRCNIYSVVVYVVCVGVYYSYFPRSVSHIGECQY